MLTTADPGSDVAHDKLQLMKSLDDYRKDHAEPVNAP